MAAMKYCVVLVLLYSIPVTATTTTTTVFHTNCTRPSSGFSFNFVTAPNTRGTMEILWSCLFTLLICTWQVQHPNVPPQDSSGVAVFFGKLYWMFYTLSAPEFLVGIALDDLLAAKRSVRYMQRELPELVEHGGWTMTHAYYANMFGFMVRRRVDPEPDLATTPISTNTIIFRAFGTTRTDLLVLNAERMIIYLKSLPSPIVFITEAEIQCRAKGDVFLKCIAGFQVFWFIVQVCARKARNLPISLLEIAVLAFAVCTLTSYLLWIKKPQNVSVPTFLDEGPEPLPISPDWFDSRVDLLRTYVMAEDSVGLNLPALGIELHVGLTGFSVGGTIFGAIHLLAWNLQFPTHFEKILWRTCAIATTAIPPLLLPLKSLGSKTGCMDGSICFLFYGFFRGLIVVETLRSLTYFPSGAFATTWSTYIPHVN